MALVNNEELEPSSRSVRCRERTPRAQEIKQIILVSTLAEPNRGRDLFRIEARARKNTTQVTIFIFQQVWLILNKRIYECLSIRHGRKMRQRVKVVFIDAREQKRFHFIQDLFLR